NVVVAEGGAPSETQAPVAAPAVPAVDGQPPRAAEVPASFAEGPASPIAPVEPAAASDLTASSPAKPEP
ncbi:hypothetical protein RFY41_08130, partial [Acinetobacter soli]|uniref:hypothetical protein n=1 Tax=Acinetobacter soli TaxID=487316 RepID=UPI0028140BD9